MSKLDDRLSRIEERLGGDDKSPLDRFDDWVDKLEEAENEVDKSQEVALSSVATNLAVKEEGNDTEIKASSDLQTLNEDKQSEAESLSDVADRESAGSDESTTQQTDYAEINNHLKKIESDVEETKDKVTQIFQGDDYTKEASENEVEPLNTVAVADRETEDSNESTTQQTDLITQISHEVHETNQSVENIEQNTQVEGDSSITVLDPIESLADAIAIAGIEKPLEGDLAEQVRNLSVDDRARLGQMLFPPQASIVGSDLIQVQGMNEDDRLRYLEGNMSAAEQQWWKINQALLTVEETAKRVYDNETRLINIEDILTRSVVPDKIEDADYEEVDDEGQVQADDEEKEEEKKENEETATGITTAIKENTATQIEASNKQVKFSKLTLSMIESKFKEVWDKLPFIISGVLLIYLLLRKAWIALGDTIKGWFEKIWDGIVSVAKWVWDAMPKWVQDALRWIWDKIEKGWNWVKGIVKSIIGPELTWNDRGRVIAETQKELQKATGPKLEQARNEFNEAQSAYDQASKNGVTGEELDSLKSTMDLKEGNLYKAEYEHEHTYVDAATAFDQALAEEQGHPMSEDAVRASKEQYEKEFRESIENPSKSVWADRHRDYESRWNNPDTSSLSQDGDNTGGEGFDNPMAEGFDLPIVEAFDIIKTGKDLTNKEVSQDQVLGRLRVAYPELTEQQLNTIVSELTTATSKTDSRFTSVVSSVDKWLREANERKNEEPETVEQVTEAPVGDVVEETTTVGIPWMEGEKVELDGGIQVSEAASEVSMTTNDQSQGFDTRVIKEDRGITEILQPEQVYQNRQSTLNEGDLESKEAKALAVNNSTVNNQSTSVFMQVYNTQDGVNYI